MTEFEMLANKVAAMDLRQRRLEVLFDSRAVMNADEREAERIATALGFEVQVIFLSKNTVERRALSKALAARHSSFSRIARALNCCEKTVQRSVQ